MQMITVLSVRHIMDESFRFISFFTDMLDNMNIHYFIAIADFVFFKKFGLLQATLEIYQVLKFEKIRIFRIPANIGTGWKC